MRQALPLWYCLDYDTQVKLAPMLEDLYSIPPLGWVEWLPPETERIIADYDRLREIDRFMRQRPRGLKQVR